MRNLLLVFLGAIAAPLFAQTARQSIEVNVLEVEAVVLDRRGNTVDGLRQADFLVRAGGKPVEVTNFYAVKRGKVVDEVAAGAPSPAPTTNNISTSVTIFLDDLHLTPGSRKRALDAIRQYVVENLGPTTMAMLVRWNGTLQVRVSPTEQAAPIVRELAAIEREQAFAASDALEREQLIRDIDSNLNPLAGGPRGKAALDVDQLWRLVLQYADRKANETQGTLAALREVMRVSSGFSGRKVILYVSDGLPTQGGADLIEYWLSIPGGEHYAAEAMRTDHTRDFERLAKDAQRLGVVLYALDPAGARVADSSAPENPAPLGRPNVMMVRAARSSGARLVADETGGRYIGDDNNVAAALAKISEQFSTYYSLGVRSQSRGLSNLAVSVKGHPEYRVLASRRRQAIPREEELDRGVRARLYARQEKNTLEASLNVTRPQSVAGSCVAVVTIAVPREKVTLLNGNEGALRVHFAVLDDRQQESDVKSAIVPIGEGPVTHTMTLAFQQRAYVLSIGLMDQVSGETSFLQRPVDATVCH